MEAKKTLWVSIVLVQHLFFSFEIVLQSPTPGRHLTTFLQTFEFFHSFLLNESLGDTGNLDSKGGLYTVKHPLSATLSLSGREQPPTPGPPPQTLTLLTLPA